MSGVGAPRGPSMCRPWVISPFGSECPHFPVMGPGRGRDVRFPSSLTPTPVGVGDHYSRYSR